MYVSPQRRESRVCVRCLPGCSCCSRSSRSCSSPPLLLLLLPPLDPTTAAVVIAASPTRLAIAAPLPYCFSTCPRCTNTRTTGGWAAARAPLRAAGRRCLPQSRMTLILVERSLRVVSHRRAERADSARGLRSRLARAPGAAAASAAAAPPRPPPTPWAFGPAAVRA